MDIIIFIGWVLILLLGLIITIGIIAGRTSK